MGTAAVWRAILMRVLWFLVALVALLLGTLILVQRVTGHEAAPASGAAYRSTVLSLSPVASTDTMGADGTRCRLTVDSAGAPEGSDGPTRIRSASACADLPQPGSAVGLTFVDEGSTVVTAEWRRPGDQPPLGLGLGLLALGAAGAILFVRANRAFSRALDEIGPPPGA